MKTELPQICDLSSTAVIAVRGADATAFLQAQLSQDLRSLATGRWALAAWHDPRGRVQALFRVLSCAVGWLLATEAELAAETVGALGRFVLRSRVDLGALGDWKTLALVDPTAEQLEAIGITLEPEPGASVFARDCQWLRIGTGLVETIGPADAFDALGLEATAAADAAVSAEIRLGLPIVSAATAGKYVPQMLNLDKLGAIAFDKGCFPGQEVIARTQNLGAVKRRACAFHADDDHAAAGGRIVNGAGEAAGDVIRAAARDGGTDLLAVVRLDSLDEPLYLETATGRPLGRIGLPFEDDAIKRSRA